MPDAKKHAGIGLDSNTLTYLVEAMSDGYQPENDSDPNLRAERVAAMRIFLYVGDLFASPSAHAEVEQIADKARLKYHDEIKNVLLMELAGLDEDQVARRTEELLEAHPKEQDCRILAEVENGGLTHLLTLDADLRTRLSGRSRVNLATASEFWEDLDLPHGATPRWAPRADNPLSEASWWRW